MSAYSGDMAESVMSDARDYTFIRKPFQIKDLLDVISSGAHARGTSAT
jgi:hypothetical protein